MTTPKPKVTLLTTVDFWEGGSGHRSRILALSRALARHTALTIVMPLALSDEARARLTVALPDASVHTLDLPPQGRMEDGLAALAGFFRACPQRACIVEFMQLRWMLAAVPAGVLKLIDTHAVASQHDAQLARIGVKFRSPIINEAQERQALASFDRVIAICEADAEVFERWLGAERVVLAPHAHEVRRTEVRDGMEQLMVVAGDYAPNREGMAWLLAQVWPRLRSLDARLVLNIVGSIGPAMGLRDGPGLRVHGIVPDLEPLYAAADLCLNPVRFGAGLKIKTVEALAHGRPLLTTQHGARSLEAHAGKAFAVADTADDFVAEALRLRDSPAARRQLADAALALAQARFSADACYGDLIAALQK